MIKNGFFLFATGNTLHLARTTLTSLLDYFDYTPHASPAQRGPRRDEYHDAPVEPRTLRATYYHDYMRDAMATNPEGDSGHRVTHVIMIWCSQASCMCEQMCAYSTLAFAHSLQARGGGPNAGTTV